MKSKYICDLVCGKLKISAVIDRFVLERPLGAWQFLADDVKGSVSVSEHRNRFNAASNCNKISKSRCLQPKTFKFGLNHHHQHQGKIQIRYISSLVRSRSRPFSSSICCQFSSSHQLKKMSTSKKGSVVSSSTWVRQMNKLNVQDLKVKDTPASVSFKMAGLGPECYDKFGQPKIQSLLFSALAIRLYAYHVPYNTEGDVYLDWERVTADRLAFMSSMVANYSKSLYNPETDTSMFSGNIILDYIGNSSVALETDLLSKDQTAEPLFTMTSQVVSVDKATRKPTPLPDWFKEKFGDKGVSDKGLVIKPFPRPDETFVHKLKVRWSDTDAYNHTNFASYVTFALDAVYASLAEKQKLGESSAQLDGILGLSGDIIAKGVKRLQVSYQSESLMGQDLDAHIWQEEADGDLVVRCSIERGDRKICQIVIDYHS